MANLSIQQISQTGLAPTMQAASAAGDVYSPSSQTILVIKNGDTVAHTVTIQVTATAYGEPVPNVAVTVPAGATVLGGPYDAGEVAGPTGLASITYDAVTNVSIAAVQVAST